MPRIVCIDYGKKRTGLAVTDPLQIIATALETVETKNIFPFLKAYLAKESVEAFVLGLPINLKGEETKFTGMVMEFKQQLNQHFPEIPVYTLDERFTSKIALQTMIEGGTSKKYRKDKSNLDKISAVIILQSYLESRS